MRYHIVTTGYEIGDHTCMLGFLKVVCKSITYKNIKYKPSTFKNLMGQGIMDNMDELWDAYNSDDVKFEYYDDIINNKGSFTYKYNKNIKIGDTMCVTMIYILSVGDYSEDRVYVNDNTILDIVKWKKILVKQGRLDKSIKFGSIGNCCT